MTQCRKYLDRALRRLYYRLLHLAYKKAAKKKDIILAEPEATEAIVRQALKVSGFAKSCVTKSVVQNAMKTPEFIASGTTKAVVQGMLKMPEFIESGSTKAVVQSALKMPQLIESGTAKAIVQGTLKMSQFIESGATKSIVQNTLKIPEFVESGTTKSIIQSVLKVSGITESIIPNAINSPAFVETLCAKKPSTGPSETIQKSWNEFFNTTTGPAELRKLQDRLVANTDELSREVVARYIARRRFHREYGQNRTLWKVVSKTLGLLYPLDYAEQERIISLGKAYQCPYKLLPASSFHEHLATGFGFGQFPSEIQKQVIGKDIIDGGGCCGDSAMIFTEYGPGKVYTFEANPDTVPGMERILAENAEVLGDRKDQIQIVPMALGESKGTLTLFSRGEFDGAATILPHDYETKAHEVAMISIDDFVAEHALNVGLIKLDLEGADYDTLLGAKETILKQKPLLILSIYHTFRDFFEMKPLIESWEAGYTFEIRHHCPCLPNAELVLMAYCAE